VYQDRRLRSLRFVFPFPSRLPPLIDLSESSGLFGAFGLFIFFFLPLFLVPPHPPTSALGTLPVISAWLRPGIGCSLKLFVDRGSEANASRPFLSVVAVCHLQSILVGLLILPLAVATQQSDHGLPVSVPSPPLLQCNGVLRISPWEGW